jgi:RNA recognition motif-containing protein
VNIGDSDVSIDGIPSQFLLVRGLESSVTEELLAKGVAKLYKSSEAKKVEPAKKPGAKVASTTASANLGAQEGSIRRVFLVRDRLSDESWRFGLAEFHTVEDAQAALVKFNALDKFTIASKPVLLSYVHAGVFVPSSIKSDDDQKFCFSPAAHPHLKLQYWDHLGYLHERVVSEAAPGARSMVDQNQANPPQYGLEGLGQNVKAGDVKTKKRKAEAGSAAPNKKVSLRRKEYGYGSNISRHFPLTCNSGKIDMRNFVETRKPRKPVITNILLLPQPRSPWPKKILRPLPDLTLTSHESAATCAPDSSRQMQKSTSTSGSANSIETT